jgi:uncharacterized membrane protein YraQ (UPF0718 family)
MTTYILYSAVLILLLISYIKDKNKTYKALQKGLKSFEGIMPQFLGIIFIIGLVLALLQPQTISKLIGSESGFLGTLTAAIVGSVAMMPTFVAFPTANMLLQNGAGYAQVGALVSTLTLIGVITFPMEAKYIGRRAAFIRNLLAFVFSFLVAYVIAKVVGGV